MSKLKRVGAWDIAKGEGSEFSPQENKSINFKIKTVLFDLKGLRMWQDRGQQHTLLEAKCRRGSSPELARPTEEGMANCALRAGAGITDGVAF